ncbi:MAG TPA: hypothetical protein VD969_00390 [Symbiobacteriaceae bacterium]|nr:hypothetical protein [Symbiobacteriaceae bacterium]
MTARRFILIGAAFTGVFWLLGVLGAVAAAYVYARVRGNLLPDGSVANSGPLEHWVSMNFRAYLPRFLLLGTVVGLAVGQVQFWLWLRHAGKQ